ncbi:PREDICTED: protein CBFA2T1-like [Acropora digitifera]|uniref:protein CBFA2T1-like n=1 Tax=Acropora digitifera TaxID=70779 RepID=UPI00077A8805|nr:PREDICTED: protein CBFA2T1-like [Acropora digitifera]
MSVKNLLVRVKELREDMESCQERMTHLLQDYQLNVLQTAAVIAAAKINEEKAEIEKKRQGLREQIEKEKRRGRETVDKVYKSAGETIQALIRDHEKEIQQAMQRRYRENAEQNVKAEIERKRDQHLKGVKRKHSAHEESEEFDEDKGDGLQCKHCGRLSPSMFICTQCNTTLYCDEYCQERDWERHQQDCSGDCATNTLADDQH